MTGKKQAVGGSTEHRGKKERRVIAPSDSDDPEVDQLESETETAGKKTKEKKRANRRKKHPDAPKKPATGYLRYRSEVYQATKAEFPQLTVQDLTKKIATMWNTLPNRQKAPYVDEWKEEQIKWAAKMKTFNDNLAMTSSTSNEKKPRKPHKPHKPQKKHDKVLKDEELDPYDEAPGGGKKRKSAQEGSKVKKRKHDSDAQVVGSSTANDIAVGEEWEYDYEV